MDRLGAEVQVLRPVQFVGRRIVTRGLGPPDEIDRGVSLPAPLLVRLADAPLHLAEQIVVVDRRGVVVLDEAVLVVTDHHRPRLPVEHPQAGRHDHPQGLAVRRVPPSADYETGLAGVQIAKLGRQLEGREAPAELHVPGLVVEPGFHLLGREVLRRLLQLLRGERGGGDGQRGEQGEPTCGHGRPPGRGGRGNGPIYVTAVLY